MAERAVAAAASGQRDERRPFVTPEGVDLGLRIALAGERVSAFLIDALIMIAILVLATVLALVGAFSIGSELGFQVVATIWLLGFFVLRNGYFILFEMGARAATWGKRRVGLRVVARSGGRLTADAVIARNLMREIELFLPLTFALAGTADEVDGWIALFGLVWTGIFLFFPFFNRDRLRVGDLLAGTIVVDAPRPSLGRSLVEGDRPAARFSDAQLEAYGAYELQTLERVLRTGDAEAMATVAATIRSKIGYAGGEDDGAFLTLYYEALKARLERAMLFGRRRRDKHDLP